jgi:hypothetical protein
MIGSSESWSVNRTHISGTHVPAEEPSTASRAEFAFSVVPAGAHLASPHIDAYRAKAPDLLAEPADIKLWSEIEGD